MTSVNLKLIIREILEDYVLPIHGVHQLVFVGELLIVELLLQVVHSIFVKNGQPYCRFVRSRPFDSVPFVSGNVHKITGLHFHKTILELKSRCTLQDNHPFVFVLVVPKSIWRGLSVGDNPFNSDVGDFEQRGEKLVGKICRKVGELIGGHCLCCVPIF